MSHVTMGELPPHCLFDHLSLAGLLLGLSEIQAGRPCTGCSPRPFPHALRKASPDPALMDPVASSKLAA